MDHTAGAASVRLIRSCALVICGVPASGKTTLAGAAARRLGWPLIGTDHVRKQLAGMGPGDPAGPVCYSPSFSRLVYTEIGFRAAAHVRASGTVIVDGTFRRRRDRAAFTAAFAEAAPALFAECQLPRPDLLARAAARDQLPGQVSDATTSVVRRECDRWEPLEEVASGQHAVIRTSQPAAAAAAELIAALTISRCP
jgi:uncharacterized protein